jgi:hypothetical protein
MAVAVRLALPKADSMHSRCGVYVTIGFVHGLGKEEHVRCVAGCRQSPLYLGGTDDGSQAGLAWVHRRAGRALSAP